MNTRFFNRKTRSQGPADNIQLATDRIGRIGRMGQCIPKKVQTNVILLSPFHDGKPFKIDLKVEYIKDEFARLIARAFSEVLHHLNVNIPNKWKLNNVRVTRASFLKFANDWNEAVKTTPRMPRTRQSPAIFRMRNSQDCPKDLLKSILDFCKDVTIRDESVLKSASYGDKMYGAVSDDEVLSWASELNIGDKDIVVDLGSGIGNIVCLLGPYVKKAVGIEFVESTAEIADEHHRVFAKLMSWMGIHNIPITLHKAEMQKFEELITKEATVLVFNNKQFGPEIMNEMREMFGKCEHVVNIISTLPLIGEREENSNRQKANHPLVRFGKTEELKKSTKYNTNFQSKPCQFYKTTFKPPFAVASATRRRT